ncbi:MAG TPA: HAMP domain-containing protein, partial [Pirellulales bacterium]|nr:HAMP domain-containing protein [Pirellulales bacterium]
MKKRRLLWQLYPSYLFITIVSLLAVGWFASHSLEQFYLDQTRSQLLDTARAVDVLIGDSITAVPSSELERLAEAVGSGRGTRVSLVGLDGTIVRDTEAPLPLQNHGDRPEVQTALAGEVGTITRYSTTLEQPMIYVAIPAMRQGKMIGVVRAAAPLEAVNARMASLRFQIFMGGMALTALMALVALAISQRISRPLEEMRAAADRFARGELGYKMLVPDSAEMAGLATTLNRMSEELEERVGTIVRQRNEQEAVLASMEEGVLAVDPQQRIISLNKA